MTTAQERSDRRDDPADTMPPADAVPLTLRLHPDTKARLDAVKDRTGHSLNSLINEAVEFSMTLPGGAALIDRERRKIIPQDSGRGEQVWAAVAYLLSYLGQAEDAQRAWPWTQPFPGTGTITDLVAAGGLAAAEIDLAAKRERGKDGGWD